MISLDDISAIILAAGKSSRMGTPKMLLPWGDRSVLGQVIFTLQSAGIQDIRVVMGSHPTLVEDEARRWGAQTILNPDYERGEMLSSIQAGIRGIMGTAKACLLALGDNPQMEAAVVRGLLDLAVNLPAEGAPGILMPSYRMRRGHPWYIQQTYWPEILALHPPDTMRDFFNKVKDQISYLICECPSILKDLDTPQDYQQGLAEVEGKDNE